jgi:hypothetical protein
VVALINAAVVYVGLLPCGIGDSESSFCRGLVYQTDGHGTYLLTPRSSFYYPAHVLLVLPIITLAGWLVARGPTTEKGRAALRPSGVVFLVLSYLVAFVTALSFTKLAFGG